MRRKPSLCSRRIDAPENHDRLEDVQRKVALRAGEANGHIVTHHLHANHGQRLALRRVHFARQDRGTGFILRQRQLAQAAARTGSKPADVIGDLHGLRWGFHPIAHMNWLGDTAGHEDRCSAHHPARGKTASAGYCIQRLEYPIPFDRTESAGGCQR